MFPLLRAWLLTGCLSQLFIFERKFKDLGLESSLPSIRQRHSLRLLMARGEWMDLTRLPWSCPTHSPPSLCNLASRRPTSSSPHSLPPFFHILMNFSRAKSSLSLSLSATELLLILHPTPRPVYSAGSSLHPSRTTHCLPLKDGCWQRGKCRWGDAEDVFFVLKEGCGRWAVWTEIWRGQLPTH